MGCVSYSLAQVATCIEIETSQENVKTEIGWNTHQKRHVWVGYTKPEPLVTRGGGTKKWKYQVLQDSCCKMKHLKKKEHFSGRAEILR